MSLDKLNQLQNLLSTPKTNSSATGPANQVGGPVNVDVPFKDLLKQSILEVNAMKNEADNLQQKLATGEIQDVGQVVNAVEKADLAFKLLMQVRNKLTDAYQEVLRMRT